MSYIITKLLKDDHRKIAKGYVDWFRERTSRRSFGHWEQFVLWVVLRSKAEALKECTTQGYDPKTVLEYYKEAIKQVEGEIRTK